MRKIILAVAILIIVIGLAFKPIVGFSIFSVANAVNVVTALGAKLACSGRYLTGLNAEQISQDLAAYSPVTSHLNIDYNQAKQMVSVDLFGLSSTVAKYRKGIGCTLEIGDTRRLDEITIPSAISVDPSVEWPIGSRVSSIKLSVQAETDNMLLADNQKGLDTRALLVISNGEIVAESYSQEFDANTQFLGWSMGKSLTSLLIGRMETLNLVDVNQVSLFSEWAHDARNDITLEHLLTMTSGLDFPEDYHPDSAATKMLFTAHSASDIVLPSQASSTPNTHFSYSSGTTNLIARWIYNTLEEDPQLSTNFLHRELLAPLSMHRTTVELDPSGVMVGSSYVYASARDWARLALLILQDGVSQGQVLINSGYIERAQQPNISQNDKRYGYQFWLNGGGDELRWPSLPEDAFFMSGSNKQFVMMVPSLDIAVVRLGWTSGQYPTNAHFSALIDAVLKETVAP